MYIYFFMSHRANPLTKPDGLVLSAAAPLQRRVGKLEVIHVGSGRQNSPELITVSCSRSRNLRGKGSLVDR